MVGLILAKAIVRVKVVDEAVSLSPCTLRRACTPTSSLCNRELSTFPCAVHLNFDMPVGLTYRETAWRLVKMSKANRANRYCGARPCMTCAPHLVVRTAVARVCLSKIERLAAK